MTWTGCPRTRANCILTRKQSEQTPSFTACFCFGLFFLPLLFVFLFFFFFFFSSSSFLSPRRFLSCSQVAAHSGMYSISFRLPSVFVTYMLESRLFSQKWIVFPWLSIVCRFTVCVDLASHKLFFPFPPFFFPLSFLSVVFPTPTLTRLSASFVPRNLFLSSTVIKFHPSLLHDVLGCWWRIWWLGLRYVHA